MDENLALVRAKSQLAAVQVMMTMAANTPDRLDAVAVFPGRNDRARHKAAFNETRAYGAKYLLVTGANPEDHDLYGPVSPRDVEFDRADGVVRIWEDPAKNAPEQVRHLISLLRKCPAGMDIGFVADAWHITRVVLTWCKLLQSTEKAGAADRKHATSMKIWPLLAAVSCPMVDIPGSSAPRHAGQSTVVDAAVGEADRLFLYPDHIGTLDDLVWLMRQNGQLPLPT